MSSRFEKGETVLVKANLEFFSSDDIKYDGLNKPKIQYVEFEAIYLGYVSDIYHEEYFYIKYKGSNVIRMVEPSCVHKIEKELQVKDIVWLKTDSCNSTKYLVKAIDCNWVKVVNALGVFKYVTIDQVVKCED